MGVMLERWLILSTSMAVGAALSVPAYGYDTITTLPATTVIYQFGVPDSSTYGQTFTVPLGNDTLVNYSFELQYGTGASVPFEFYIAQWNGADVTGPLLYQSSLLYAPGSGSETYTIQTMLGLTTGQQYVAFISTSNVDRSVDGTFYEYGSYANYTGGGFVYQNNGADSSQWTSGQWATWPVPQSAFTANFINSTAPAPAALWPLVSGLALSRRPRRKT